FFFQAEDGIRDLYVTGVQTCALPICRSPLSEPTVGVKGVTITGGVAVSNPTDPAGTRDFGGGIEIPWAADGGTGATVTISDSVVTGNRATPTTTIPSNGAQCPDGPCPFARGDGGGIGNYGRLTLIRTTLSTNVHGGPVASDAHGC